MDTQRVLVCLCLSAAVLACRLVFFVAGLELTRLVRDKCRADKFDMVRVCRELSLNTVLSAAHSLIVSKDFERNGSCQSHVHQSLRMKDLCGLREHKAYRFA